MIHRLLLLGKYFNLLNHDDVYLCIRVYDWIFDVFNGASRLRDRIMTIMVLIDYGGGATNGDVIEAVAYKAFNVSAIKDAPGDFTVGNNLTALVMPRRWNYQW